VLLAGSDECPHGSRQIEVVCPAPPVVSRGRVRLSGRPQGPRLSWAS